MIVQSLTIDGWRQFGKIDINFHPRLTVLTGSNGAGKSTLLKIISNAFGQTESLIATPLLSSDKRFVYSSGILNPIISLSKDPSLNSFSRIGTVFFDEHEYSLRVPKDTGVSYSVAIFKEPLVNLYSHGGTQVSDFKGLYIRSHRPANTYQQVGNIPTNIITAQNAYSSYQETIRQVTNNSYSQFSPTYRIKEAIISMATFGPGNLNVQGNDEVNTIYNNFKLMLRKILPREIGFRDISVRIPDVVLVTDSGEFIIDSSSGGLMSLIDLAWQIFLYSIDNSTFTVLLDEPENHLHPSMQRTVMSSLLDAFPNVQFIVATHSPFVVTSVKDSSVYVLKHEHINDEIMSKRVYSYLLGNTNKSATASETLREVLGVPVTLPMWAEEEIDLIIKKIQPDKFTDKTLENLRDELKKSGLEEHFPAALNSLLGQLHD